MKGGQPHISFFSFGAKFKKVDGMTPTRVLWAYIILLVVGGLIGFWKAKSQISLVMSVSFAAALSLCAAGIVFQPYVANILLAVLMVVFAMRLVKTKKFMPSAPPISSPRPSHSLPGSREGYREVRKRSASVG